MSNTETVTEQTVKKYGKFADAETLLAAYENLEKEFTKKSQKLRQMEKSSQYGDLSLNCSDASPTSDKILNKEIPSCDNEKVSPHDMSDNFINQNPTYAEKSAADNPEQSNDRLNPQQILADRDFVEKHILQNDEIAQEILRRYIDILSKSELPRTINSRAGTISLTPPKKPKSIKEASRLAENFFNK